MKRENNHHDIVKKIEDAATTRSGLNKSGFGESLGRTMYEREEELRVRSQIVIAKWWRGYILNGLFISIVCIAPLKQLRKWVRLEKKNPVQETEDSALKNNNSKTPTNLNEIN